METASPRQRRVLVVGACGLIGAHVLARLQARRIDIVAIGTGTVAAARRFPYARWIEDNRLRWAEAGDWADILDGVDAVVNCGATAEDAPPDKALPAFAKATLALYHACEDAGIHRIVHVSTSGSCTRRHEHAEREIEGGLRALELDWLILRPGLIFAPGSGGASALLCGLAAFPLAIPAVHAASTLQLVAAEDVAEAVVRASEPWRQARLTIDVVGPDAQSFGESLKALRAWLGLPPAPLLRLPAILAWPFVALAGCAAWLGWRNGMTPASLRRLRAGSAGDPGALQRILGLKARDLASLLVTWPTGLRGQQTARAHFLKPIAILTLALCWIATGILAILSIVTAHDAPSRAWPPLLDLAVVVAASLAAIGLGAASIIRRRSKLALRLMVLSPLLYLAVMSAIQPELWLDPLGPMIKVIPAMMLALIVSTTVDGA